MLRTIVFIVALCVLPTQAAEIYTWIDATGKTHYGDQPPVSELPVRKLDDSAAVSVVGDSALRETERDFLKAAEQSALELRLAREAAAAERARNRPAEVQVVTVEQPRDYYYDYPYYRYRPYYSDYRARKYQRKYKRDLRWSLGYRDDRFRLRIGNDHNRYGDDKPRYPHRQPPRVAPSKAPKFKAATTPSKRISIR